MADVLVPWWWYRTLNFYLVENTKGLLTVNLKGDYRAGAGVVLDENNNVIDIVEKPQDPNQEFDWNNSGIMLLSPESNRNSDPPTSGKSMTRSTA